MLILICFVTVGYTPVVYGISPYTWVIYIYIQYIYMAYTPVISSYGLSPMGSARNTLQLTYTARMDEIPEERFGDLPRDDSG